MATPPSSEDDDNLPIPGPTPPRPNPTPHRPNPTPPRPNPTPPRPNPTPPRLNPLPGPNSLIFPGFPQLSLNYLKATVVF
jgi:hypothetical protein